MNYSWRRHGTDITRADNSGVSIAKRPNMQRRVLLQSSMGLLMLSPWGFVRSGETLPSDAEVISSFGWATDVHHCRKSPDFWDEEGVAHHEYFDLSLEKFRKAVAFMNKRRPDFAIELGDFKDCTKTGSRAETVQSFGIGCGADGSGGRWGCSTRSKRHSGSFPDRVSISPATMTLTKFRLRIFWRTLKTQTR